MDKCHTHAANGKFWNINVHRDEFYDVQKCKEKCGELTQLNLKIDKRICGICISVCLVGKK
ncbi:MAG: hypothetical protein JXJ22_13585 [Bacteroidales bacterium]|nr:hypothetical protein [Bacteroidales bacterium]